jgi:hypothetical protein
VTVHSLLQTNRWGTVGTPFFTNTNQIMLGRGGGGDEDCFCVKKTGGPNDVGCNLKLAFMFEKEL